MNLHVQIELNKILKYWDLDFRDLFDTDFN